MKTRPTIDEIAAAIDAAMPELDSTDRQSRLPSIA